MYKTERESGRTRWRERLRLRDGERATWRERKNVVGETERTEREEERESELHSHCDVTSRRCGAYHSH